jgi:hypothetical protein
MKSKYLGLIGGANYDEDIFFKDLKYKSKYLFYRV